MDANTLTAFFEGDLDGERANAVEVHLDVCAECRRVLAVLGSSEAAPARASQIGRYEVLGILGQGGMGVVYLARDPALGRNVAIKLVRSSTPHAPELHARLLREAQTMARLSHPNVAAVHDVGTEGEQVFVALEYVEGTTLAGWLKAPRTWREVLDVMIPTARGLAAAHAAGVIHRDFKPSNVLIGREGRPRVADFGLARAGEDGEARALGSSVPAEPHATRTGALVGSPAYMAPEQLAGRAADARSDQFGFAVTLYEALYRRRPFIADGVEALARAIATGPAEPSGRAPRRVWRIVQRALHADPARRYPSIEVVIRDLERARRGYGTAIVAGAIGAVAVAAGVVWIASRDVTAPGPACRFDDQLAGVWDVDRREATRAAVLATGVPYAPATAELVVRELDDYSSAWIAMRTDACEATHVRGEQSDQRLDQRMRCLDRRRLELDALVDSLARVDAKSAAKASDATRSLAAIGDCATGSDDRPPENPGDRARDDAWYAQLAKARSADVFARFAESYDGANRVAAAARSAGARGVEAEALLTAGIASEHLGELARADELMRDAALAAEVSRLDAVAARARIGRIKTAVERARLADAQEYVLAARAAVQRAGTNPRLEQQLATQEGIVLARRGKFDDARARFQVAADLARAHDPDQVATTLNNLGGAQLQLGQLDAAGASYVRAIGLRVEALGQRHPAVGTARLNLGAVYTSQGKHAEALEQFRASLAILEPVLGREHPRIATLLIETAGALVELERMPEALELLQRAVAIEERLGIERPEVAAVHGRLGDAYAASGRHAEALAEFRTALALTEKTLGPEHPHVGQSLNNMANTLVALRKFAEARAAFERAIAIKTRALGDKSPSLMPSLTGLAQLDVADGHPERAIAPLERALVLAAEGDPADRATIRFSLADALWQANRDRARAIELAREARTGFAANQAQLAAVDAWLATHRR